MLHRQKLSSSPPCTPAQRSCAVWGQAVDSQCSLPVLDTQELTAFPAAVSYAPGCAEGKVPPCHTCCEPALLRPHIGFSPSLVCVMWSLITPDEGRGNIWN